MWKNQQKDALVELAFLELMEPILYSAVESLINQGANNIKIVTVFWKGDHLRKDFSILINSCKNPFLEIHLSKTPTVSEDIGVL